MDCGNCMHDLSCMNQQFIEFWISALNRIQLKYEGVASPNALEYAYLGSREDSCVFWTVIDYAANDNQNIAMCFVFIHKDCD